MGCLLIFVFFCLLGLKYYDPCVPWWVVISPLAIVLVAITFELIYNFKHK